MVRSVPLVAEYKDQYYESLALAMFRMLIGLPAVEPRLPAASASCRATTRASTASCCARATRRLAVPVADGVTTLVPFRGPGGADGGSFKYVSAADVLAKRLAAGSLKDKIVLVGTTAPGLLDMRVTPVGEAYAGVETHANLISGLLDGRIVGEARLRARLRRRDPGAGRADPGVRLAAAVRAARGACSAWWSSPALVALNFWLYLGAGLVLPLAAALVMAFTAFALNMSYGYFVESRSKRELANLFGTYVPPELVDEMVKDPDSYSMKATSKELTVMFCDMRGFTKMSEKMEPTQLQELLNAVFSRLTDLIRANRGTIDKYMGDCVMAFWGAPVDIPNHAHMAVKTAMEMANAVRKINEEHRAKGIPEIGIGIGLNTGTMCVGDMGSHIRRATP